METRAAVLIVGAGMVGRALALALQASGLDVRAVDAGPLSVEPADQTSGVDPRPHALPPASHRRRHRLGCGRGYAPPPSRPP
ncbi:2-octaprenyl-3-methyl-6-methoxy-1,4-benzoquinol hydroxylase, partial [Pseudomonas syringae]